MSRPDLIAGSRHGTVTNYTYGCRCAECRAANTTAALARQHSRNGLPPGDPRHGTVNGYRNWRCGCGECAEANAAALREWRGSQSALVPDDPRHGTVSAYTNYGCRCDACRAARKFVASRPPALEGDRAAGPPRPAAQPLNDKGKSC